LAPQSFVHVFWVWGAIAGAIATVKSALAERVATLDASLKEHLPEAQYTLPEGGYFMWVELPEGTDVAAMFAAAAERGVQFVKGTDFLLEGGENTLRLAYSGVTNDQIDEGVRRLAEAYRSLAGTAAVA
jgi:DNA-binding transcriptional MocR family regulator